MERRNFLALGAVASLQPLVGREDKPTTPAADMSRGRLPYGTLEAHVGIGALVDEVHLDGVKLQDCWRANEVEGWADVYQNFPSIVRKTGRVVFTFREKV